jgi:hypothetical protein
MRNLNKGLGDLTAKLANFTGAKDLVKSVLGEDCGCDERQELMNELLPFNKDEVSKEDEEILYDKALSLAFINDLITYRESGKRVSKEQFMLFWDHRKSNTSCRKCVNSAINEVERVLTK